MLSNLSVTSKLRMRQDIKEEKLYCFKAIIVST